LAANTDKEAAKYSGKINMWWMGPLRKCQW
jgi:hypothetical protein